MSIKLISLTNIPTYIAKSTDIISGCPAEGAILIGKSIYTTDTGEWYIINKDLSVKPYYAPQVDTDWYLPTGLPSSYVEAAYQPVKSSSLLASYVNIANPGTHNLTAPDAPPDFVPGTGWSFSGSPQFLNTGIDAGSDWSFLVRFSGFTPGDTNLHAIVGQKHCVGTNEDRHFGIFKKSNVLFVAVQNSFIVFPSNDSSGVFGAAEGRVFANGVFSGSVAEFPFESVSESTFLIGCWDVVGMCPVEYSTVDIQAIAIYNTKLTDEQMIEVSTAMALL